MIDRLSLRLVPDELWGLTEPLLPQFVPRPQGSGTAPVGDRAVFTAIVYVLTSGCGWRELPPTFGVTVPTVHRRFTDWTKAGLWRKLHRAVLDELGSQGLIDWSRAILDGASVQAKNDVPLVARTAPSATHYDLGIEELLDWDTAVQDRSADRHASLEPGRRALP